MTSDILIVDDERDICELIAGILSDEGFATRQATSSEAALEEVRKRAPSLVILDVWLQGSSMDGLSVLRYLKTLDEFLPVLVISGHGNFDTALAAINRGAYDYLEKPFKAAQLLLVVRRALELARLKSENAQLKNTRVTHDAWIGQSSIAEKLRQSIAKLSASNARVLILGEKGTGKRLSARLIHQGSDRSDGPFVVIDPPHLVGRDIETELFGSEAREKGVKHIGLIEKAHNGTLVLSGLHDLSHEVQRGLLHLLVDGTILRRYGKTPVSVNTRVLTTSVEPLVNYVESGQILSDLSARLTLDQLSVPPLSKRAHDIPELVAFFVQDVATKTGLNARKFSEDALNILQSMAWPGNIRQLRNLVERILILSPPDIKLEVDVDELSQDNLDQIGQFPQLSGDYSDVIGLSLRDAREQFERSYLRLQISRFDGNVSKTAEFIGMERSALHRKIKALGLSG